VCARRVECRLIGTDHDRGQEEDADREHSRQERPCARSMHLAC
jgi:hypothetical protein